MTEVTLRPARPADAPVLAALNLRAGGGIYQFLYDDRPGEPGAEPVMLKAVTAADTALSWRCATVAELQGKVIGAVTGQPYDNRPPSGLEGAVPEDRTAHVAAVREMGAPGSWFINTLAVSDGAAGRGIGRSLVEAAANTARAVGLGRLSLRVFVDNAPAIGLYETCGFKRLAVTEFPFLPRLPHTGGIALMVRAL